MSTKRNKPVSRAYGYGIEVGGPRPYVGYFFSTSEEEAKKECTQPYNKVIRVRMEKVRIKKARKS